MSEQDLDHEQNTRLRKSFQPMADKWPSAFVAREKISEFTGGIVSPGTCANLDCQKNGIKGRFRVGRKICYPVQSIIEWLTERAVAL